MACGGAWGVREEPTSYLSDLRVFSSLVVSLTVCLSNLLFQERSMCSQPVLLGLCIHISHTSLRLPRGGIWTPTACPACTLSWSLNRFFFLSAFPSGPRGTSRGAVRKAVGRGGEKKRRLRWSQEFWMIESCWEPFREGNEVILITM